MTEKELKAFLTLLMCSDPWPVPENEGSDLLQKFADAEAQRYGYSDWIEAYHLLGSLGTLGHSDGEPYDSRIEDR